MSNNIQIKSLALLALTLAGTASAQEITVPTAGPNVTVAGAPQTTHVEMGATRSFKMRGRFAGIEAANELSGRLMARGRSLAAPMELNLTLSPDGSQLIFIDSEDPSAFVQVSPKTGDISFCRGMKGFEVEENTKNLPEGDGAIRTAIDHLQRLNLMPSKRAELVVQHIGGLRMSQRSEDGSTADYDKLVTVHFGREIDGLPVGGPGSKITVHLGANGELVGMQRRWIEFNAQANSDEAFLSRNETLASAESHLRKEWANALNVTSERPQLGLFDDGNGMIEPAFFFRAELEYDAEVHEFAKGDYTNDYLGIIPALRQSRARFQQLEEAPVLAQTAGDTPPVDPVDDDEPSDF